MKTTLRIVFIIAFSVMMKAQVFKYGFTGGFHKTSIVGIHDYSEGKFGGNLGFFANVSLVENDVFDSSWLYLQPQIEFAMEGEHANPPEGYQKFLNNYVAAQVYLKYFFHKGNMKRDVFIFAGPRVEYLISEERKGPPVYDMFVDMEKRINKFGYGASFGVGLKVTPRLEGILRYDRGFSHIYPDYSIFNTYNRMLSLGFNYYLSPIR